MFCPDCRAEYREGFLTCSECGTALVEQLPPEPAELPPEAYVTVLTTACSDVLALAESILEGAEIDYFVNGEDFHDLFATGPVDVQVPVESAEEARALLAELEEPDAGESEATNNDLDVEQVDEESEEYEDDA